MTRHSTQLEQSTSHFDRRALLWALADQLPEGAEVAALDQAVDRLLASERVICVHEPRDLLDQAHFTTPRIAELERRFIEGALAGAGAKVGMVSQPGGRGGAGATPLPRRRPAPDGPAPDDAAARRWCRSPPGRGPARRRRWRPHGRPGRRPGTR